jgi:chromosome segregation ATPase
MNTSLTIPGKTFIPPDHSDEPKIATLFLQFPDVCHSIKTTLSKGCLSGFSICKQISKHFETITLVMVIISVAIATICAISLFFITAATVKTTFLIIALVAAVPAVLITAGYIKQYFHLKRVQKEAKFLEECSKELQKAYNTLEQNNKMFTVSIENLNKEIKIFEQYTLELKTSVEHLTAENTTFKTSNAQFASLNATLNTNLENLKKINALNEEKFKALQLEFFNENQKLADSNSFLQTSIEDLRQIEASLKEHVKKAELQYEQLKNFNEHHKLMAQILHDLEEETKELKKQIHDLAIVKSAIDATLEKNQQQNIEISELLTRKKTELEEITQKLMEVTNNLHVKSLNNL